MSSSDPEIEYPVLVTVRDSRAGRDPRLVGAEGGDVLHAFAAEHPLNPGDRLLLPDGSEVEVVAYRDSFDEDAWRQTVHVDDVWDVPALLALRVLAALHQRA